MKYAVWPRCRSCLHLLADHDHRSGIGLAAPSEPDGGMPGGRRRLPPTIPCSGRRLDDDDALGAPGPCECTETAPSSPGG